MQVQQEIRNSTIVVFISKYSGVLIGILINSTLARLLSPKEFGVLSVVTVFITFFNILSDIGLGSGIVQNQNLTYRDLSDIFKLSAILSVVLALLFCLCAFGIASFYDNQEYIRICQMLSVHLFFSALAVIPRNLLVKEKAFKTLGFIDTSVALVTGLVAILLAWHQFSYYSMIWRSIFSSILVFSLYFTFSNLKLHKGMALAGARKIAGYSSYQFAFNFINYFSRNLDNILIGKFMGNASLGIYNQAYQLMIYPVSYLTNVITPVLHPILAKFQDNKTVIFQEYLKVVNILAKLGIPLSLFIYFSAEEIILIMLGNQWLGVIPILRILSFSVWVQMILSSSGSIFQASGRTDLLFLSGVLSAVMLVCSILVGVLYFKSVETTALLLVISFYINFLQAFYLLIKTVLKSSLLTFAQIFLRQVPQALILILLLLAFTHYDGKFIQISIVLSLFIKLTLLSATFLIFNFSFFETFIKRYLTKSLNR
ncbi:lipopolysaccharide biosynthesis protein [Dyadobacter pollutisoli]|uniref:Lipopolysaccharide biosynthesis protein n=1 Tax=Dyadobacter pollutisoli TaxID=2910158 RepID=A0A9E8NCM2_9BACT|nr:lipopolysaccharide biosynthesis protein [Dyadobacter pollutisoli]WAC11922.1 lipopolysaccharide biosynthesis protein [Dyadobacter pollutisoli]